VVWTEKLKGSKPLLFGFAVFFTGVAACTYTIKQSQGFSDVGIKYADAVSELIEVTTDTVIEDDSNTLLFLQILTSLEDKKEERKLFEKWLREHDREVAALVETLGRFRGHAAMLGAYFTNLQALAETDAPESTAKAVSELSATINEVGKSISETEELVVSGAESDAFASLSGLVSKGIQSAKLRAALERDAPIIAEQLLLHEKLLRKLSNILKQSAKKASINEWKVEVLQPYKNRKVNNQKAWKEARAGVLKSAFFSRTLDKATQAAKQMRMVWGNILAGETDLVSIRLLLSDINELTAVLNQLKEANSEG
jgi:hypothetical protein